MTSYIIVDDEHIAHDIIERYCDLIPNMNLEAHCYDALEAMDFLSKNTIDLIFLDLNMPKLKGFDFLKTLAHAPKVIVTTAYSEYAVEGYNLDIVDYLLKPFSFERFLKAVNKAIQNKSQKPILPSESSETKDHIFLYSDKQYVQVKLDDVLFAEASGNYVKVVTLQTSLMIREKISDLLYKLPHEQFIQVHKSFLVSARKIDSVTGNRLFIKDHSIPIGNLYKMNVMRILK